MPRKTKRQEAAERAQLLHLHMMAQEGTEYRRAHLRNARRVLSELTDPREQQRHDRLHAKQGTIRCGWCSNVTSWTRTVKANEATMPLAEAIEAEIRELSVGRTQAETFEEVRRRYARVSRERVREQWHQARRPIAA